MSASLTDLLASVVGHDRVVPVDPSPSLARALGGHVPGLAAMPGSAAEVARLLALASEHDLALVPYGVELACGAPPQRADLLLDLRHVEAIFEHEPGDLTLRASTSMPFRTLQEQLARHGQRVPIEAPHPAATLGDLVATRASGPRRHAYGTLRDHVLGLTVAAPDGKITRCGGRVVKNVTGYDLMKLHLGALHTLGVVLELNLRLQPLPERELCLLALLDSERAACELVHRVRLEPALAPAALEIANTLEGLHEIPSGGLAVAVLFEGSEAAVETQLERARALADGARETLVLAGQECHALIEALAGARAIDVSAGDVLALRCLVPRTRLRDALEHLAHGPLAARTPRLLAWAGLGIIDALAAGDLVSDAELPGEVAALAAGLSAIGGTMALRAAPPFVWAKLDRPVAEPVLRLERRLRALMDPRQVINPGRCAGLP